MIAEVQLPNAFAYGNFLTGSRIAVTRGLLNTLEIEEIEAVMAHEIGHIKHREMSIKMFVSLLPAIFYWIGRVMMYSIWLSSWGSQRQTRRISYPSRDRVLLSSNSLLLKFVCFSI